MDTKLIKSKKLRLKRARNTIGLLITFLYARALSSSKYSISVGEIAPTFNTRCPQVGKRVLISLRLAPKDPSIPISFSLLNDYDSVPPDTQFIDNPDNPGNKLYGMFQLGSKCLAHKKLDSINSVLFVMLVLAQEGTDDICKVERVVTNTELVPCSTYTTTQPLWEIFTFKGAPTPSHSSFTKVVIQNDFIFERFYRQNFHIQDIPLSGINDQLVDMALMSAFRAAYVKYPVSTYSSFPTNVLNQHLSSNPFASELKPSKMFERYTKDNLPGYYLEKYSGAGDDTHKYLQMFLETIYDRPDCLHLFLYMSHPASFTIGATHTIHILAKGYSTPLKTSALSDYDYKIQITRTATEMKFQVVRGSTNTPSLINLPYTGSTDFIYFGFTVGEAVLFHIDAKNVKAKFYETLTVFQTSTKLIDTQTYTKNAHIDSIMPEKETQLSWRWTKVEYEPDSLITSNEAGFRVYDLVYGKGIYPAYLISNRDHPDGVPECLFLGYGSKFCLAMPHLLTPTQEQTKKGMRTGRLTYTLGKNDRGAVMCKVPSYGRMCLIPKPGHIVNLEQTRRTRFYYRIDTIENYNALPQEDKDFFYEFTNSAGTKYLISCPSSCNYLHS